MYWVPGGNPELNPEIATNAELNFHMDGTIKKNLNWGFDITGFYGNVDNWILWQPTDKTYWEAQNIKTVEHSGGEFQVRLQRKWRNWNANFQGSYQYVRAINKEVADASVNKQLIYTPEHSANWLLGIQFRDFGLNTNYNFTGLRYISSDNTSYLPAYDLVNLGLTYQFKMRKKHVFNVQFDVNNVFNKEYMSVVWRAMPGTNYLFSIRYSLN